MPRHLLSLVVLTVFPSAILLGQVGTPRSEAFNPFENPPEAPAGPVRVRTQSGVLRTPGPVNTSAIGETRTPTFAPEQPIKRRPPRALPPQSNAKPIPQYQNPPVFQKRRDTAVRPASFEAPSEKKTMFSWFRGLWKKPRAIRGPLPMDRPETTVAKPAPGQSSSIDARRVYRGPAPEVAPTGRNTDFSETGVPRSKTTFEGRKGSAF